MLRSKVCCKILVLSLIFIIMVAISLIMVNPKTYAMELNYDEFDQVFLQSSRELIEEKYNGEYTIVAEKELLYDMNLQEFGYIYDFSVNGDNGFAVVVNVENEIVLEEIFFGSENPFMTNCENKRIYVNQLTYLEYCNGNYLQNGRELTKDETEYYADIAYASSAGAIETDQETIYYTSKSIIADFSLANRIPACVAETNLGNNICVPVAGANIIQYYDRYKTNLISNYTPGVGLGAYYAYKVMDDSTKDVVNKLYSDMGTNTTVAGTTINQFKDGMKKYCNRQGYSVSYSTCMSGGQISYNLVKSNLNNQKPVILFVSKTIYTEELSSNSGSDVVKNSTYIANHSLVAFGYKEIRYTFSNGSSRTVNMLEVATGIGSLGSGYLNLYKSNIINDAMSVIIN